MGPSGAGAKWRVPGAVGDIGNLFMGAGWSQESIANCRGKVNCGAGKRLFGRNEVNVEDRDSLSPWERGVADQVA
ncbi:hypothetical protein GMLC_29950 [Geomonas limicola]|uniref:Uncharacterized protein n=1 Tax=Geomonas limicola TaxID=2740186 RepID=A0A6V8NA41_9BACT|nr:hypothetical protein GMLC_29950 [Geomonas limicola]